jgi:hypothetical protein
MAPLFGILATVIFIVIVMTGIDYKRSVILRPGYIYKDNSPKSVNSDCELNIHFSDKMDEADEEPMPTTMRYRPSPSVGENTDTKVLHVMYDNYTEQFWEFGAAGCRICYNGFTTGVGIGITP